MPSPAHPFFCFRAPPFRSPSGHYGYAAVRHARLKQLGLGSQDAELAFGDVDTLGERAQVVASVGAAF